MAKPPKRVGVPIQPRRHNFDKHAPVIAKHLADRDPDEMLEAKEVASIMRVSKQWMDAARVNNFGPPWIRLGPLIVGYPCGGLLTYIRTRTKIPEYGTVPISSNRGHAGRAVKKSRAKPPTLNAPNTIDST